MSVEVLGEMAALGAAVCWAIAPIFYKQALNYAKPFAANIVRSLSNAAVMLVLLLVLGWGRALLSLPSNVIAIVVISGVLGLGVGDTLYMYGLRSIGISRAVPLAATYPMFALIWATILLRQELVWTAVAGAVVILVGIWLLSRERNDSTIHFTNKLALTGVIVCLLTAVVWSISITLMDVAVRMPGVNGLDASYALLTIRIAVMAAVFLALSPLLDKDHGLLKMNRKTVIELCLGGLVANALGWLLMNYSFLQIVESHAVPISSTTPLFSVVAGFTLFRERMTINNLMGAVVVVAGVILIFLA